MKFVIPLRGLKMDSGKGQSKLIIIGPKTKERRKENKKMTLSLKTEISEECQ